MSKAAKKKRKAKPSLGDTEFSRTRTTKYRCKECGDEFERVVVETDEGIRVVKHWMKSCTKCGGRNLKVVGESNTITGG